MQHVDRDHRPAQVTEGKRFKPLSSVTSRPLEHLWEPYLPEATFGMLEGDPWLGKSLLLQQAAVDLSRGLRPGPAPRAVGQPRRSLLLIGEENPQRVRERLERMNAKLDDIFFPPETEQGPLELEPEREGLAVLEEDVALLRPALCVIDPITVFAPRALTSQAGIRALTGHLKRIAQTYACTIIAVRHLNKGRNKNVRYRGAGRIDLFAAARFVLLAGVDPQDPERRVLVHTKNSDGPLGVSIGYAVWDGVIHWLGERNITGEDVLGGPAQAGAEADAKQFWQEALAGGPRLSCEVLEEGVNQFHIAHVTLNRARTALRIERKMVAKPGKRGAGVWFCKLPGQEWPDEEVLRAMAGLDDPSSGPARGSR